MQVNFKEVGVTLPHIPSLSRCTLKLHEEHVPVCIPTTSGGTVPVEPRLHPFKSSIFHEDGTAVRGTPRVRPAFPQPSLIWIIGECRDNMKGI